MMTIDIYNKIQPFCGCIWCHSMSIEYLPVISLNTEIYHQCFFDSLSILNIITILRAHQVTSTNWSPKRPDLKLFFLRSFLRNPALISDLCLARAIVKAKFPACYHTHTHIVWMLSEHSFFCSRYHKCCPYTQIKHQWNLSSTFWQYYCQIHYYIYTELFCLQL
jgi:hypothetical protein